MERLALAIILLVSIGALAHIIWRSLRAPRRGDACSGCPLAGGCGSTDPLAERDEGCGAQDRASAERDGSSI